MRTKKPKNILPFIFCVLCSVFCILFLFSCATTQTAKEKEPGNKSDFIGKETTVETKTPELKTPEFVPAEEDITPVQTKVVSVSARNTPLRDVLYTIAETASLNLVMERGVNPDLPITMTLNNMSVENALNIIFDSVDYFYLIKDNILIVKSVGTKIFELGQPNVIQDYQIDVGGDILGGSSGGEGQTTSVKGGITAKSASDKVSFQFWDAIESSLKTLLPAPAAGEAAAKSSFTINRMASTIMVTASKKEMERVENFIANLQKVLNRQVLIEARIIEVQLSDSLKYGIDWSVVRNWQGIGRFELKASNFKDIVSSSGAAFQIGVTGSNFTSILNALQTQGDVKTLSNPRVSIMNGQTAILSAGRIQSYISRVETTTTSVSGSSEVTYTIQTASTLSGIMFGLVPYINEDGKITLTITPIVSNLVSLESQSIGTGTNAVQIKLPTVDLRELSTTVKISDGQMVVIGGLIDKKEQLTEKKVPLLGNIPLLGNLFKSVDKSYTNTELVIMLIPKIISN
ncbi:MAG: pilus (MSHA type) biogenesis protein MshL [Nitrospirae bacterium]|nr:pilus (MSHA type) biogenesis protein MshL [Nitrospirota bacterium]